MNSWKWSGSRQCKGPVAGELWHHQRPARAKGVGEAGGGAGTGRSLGLIICAERGRQWALFWEVTRVGFCVERLVLGLQDRKHWRRETSAGVTAAIWACSRDEDAGGAWPCGSCGVGVGGEGQGVLWTPRWEVWAMEGVDGEAVS